MKYGYLRQDEDSHNYLIPEDEIEAFDKLMAEISKTGDHTDEWYDKIDEFNDRYQDYRVEGGLSSLKVVMP